jgi:heme-degrading monooxygenase HmoA
MISNTSKPPYYAVIFTSLRSPGDEGYEAMSNKMVELAQKQPGFLGMESARDENGLGITVSYWATLENIAHWRKNSEHKEAQELGKTNWYQEYKVRICKVERDYSI